jgi:diaminopimelate decarboxylase
MRDDHRASGEAPRHCPGSPDRAAADAEAADAAGADAHAAEAEAEADADAHAGATVHAGRTGPGLTDDQARLLAHRAGGTPLYAYSRAALRASADRVRRASAPGAAVYYSLKANPHPGVVTALAGLVDGFDVCSPAELETALDAGADPGRVLFTGPAKTRAEAATALAAGVAVTVESPGQAALLAGVAAEHGLPGRSVLRLNTAYPGRTPGSEPSPNQFGIDEADLPGVVALLQDSAVPVTGVQVFWGSQYADADVILGARKEMADRARAVAARFGLDLTLVSLGGGVALPWLDRDPAVDWAGLYAANAAGEAEEAAARNAVPAHAVEGANAANAARANGAGAANASDAGRPADAAEGSAHDAGAAPATNATRSKATWPDADALPLAFEYGRALVGPAGSLLTRVLDTKTVGGRRYVLVDAGLNHAMLTSRLVAGAARGEPRVRLVGGDGRGPVSPAWVTGPLCSQLDVLAAGVPLPEVHPGDLLVFPDTGAYGPTFSPSGFLSRDEVREVVF